MLFAEYTVSAAERQHKFAIIFDHGIDLLIPLRKRFSWRRLSPVFLLIEKIGVIALFVYVGLDAAAGVQARSLSREIRRLSSTESVKSRRDVIEAVHKQSMSFSSGHSGESVVSLARL
jgi:hypothetical protein